MRFLYIVILFIFDTCAFAQQDAWVYFADKPDATYYMANPLEMLSQRALDRRAAQGIVLDSKDVPVHQLYIDQVTASAGITVMAKSKWLNALHIRGSISNITALSNFTFVDHIEFADKTLNQRVATPRSHQAITKTLDVTTVYNYGNSAPQVAMLNGQTLHQQDYTGSGKIIAVMDSGFPGVNTAQPFQRMMVNNLVLDGYNFVQRTDNFYSGHFHGTYVLSTMAGYAEGQLVGTAPDAQYYLFITEDNSSENPVEESLWVEAAELADSLGVDVINTSLGYFNYDNPAYNYTYADMDGQTAFMTRGANIAFSRGMILVNSAGNSGATSDPHITVPADAFNVLTVGAVDASEVIAPFSSTGPSSDNRVKPDVVAQGVLATVSDVSGNIILSNGTSFSGPITAGLVACLWQALPDKTNLEIVQLIRQSADRYNTPNAQYGYGVPDFGLALQQAMGLPPVQQTAIMLYPNPVSDFVTIALPQNTQGNISIFNTLGQLILTENISGQTSINVTNLATGLYNYRIEAAGQVKTGKIIKQ